MDRSRSIVGALLATSSVVAMIAADAGPAYAVCSTIGSSGFTNPVNTTIPCASANNATITGNVVNAGSMTPGSPNGILINNSILNGSIINSGTISATGGFAIDATNGSTFAGGITNTGTISAAATAINLFQVSSFFGGITNSGTVTSVGGDGISVGRQLTASGGITNAGTISAGLSGIAVFGTNFSGGITNNGMITAGTAGNTNRATGIFVNSRTYGGGITNNGTITALAAGILASSVVRFAGTSAAGGITNTGTITAKTGIAVVGGSTFTGAILNSGTITAATHSIFVSQESTFTGGIVNSGSLVLTGVATGLDVSHVATFAGGISNSGTITAGNAAIGVINVSNFSGGIGNSGVLTATTSGIALTGISTFAGGITNSGRIHGGISGISIFLVTNFSGGVTNSGTISGGVGLVVSGGTAFSGAIANSGNITGTTAAIDVSAAPNAMTLNQMAGTIAGAIKLSPFADVVNVTGGTINGNIVGQGASNKVNFALGTGSFTFGSAFSISGVNQINVNSGLVILDGSNSATNVAVNGGILEIGDASHPGALLTASNGLTIGAGGTLAGHGTFHGSVAIPTGATLAPGGSIGTLNITGNLSLAAASFYQVAVTADGQNSKTVATGTAAIAGGTVQVMEQPGNYPPSFKYTILTANSGVNGTFTNATSDFAFLTPVLSYDANDVFLTLSRNATFFQSLAQTSNQRSVGAALDASPLGSAIVQSVSFQTASGARQAYDALSGEIHGSVQSALIDDSHYMRQAILGRLRQAGFTHVPDVMAALGFAGPVTVEGSGESPALGYASRTGFPVKAAPAAAPTYGSDVAFWSQGVAATGHIDGDGNAASARRDLAGFFSGVDARFGEFARVGLAGGYSHSSLSVDARASSAGIDTAHLGAYAGATFGALNLRGGAAYAFHTIDTSRTIVFPGFFDSARARYDGGTGQVFGEVGYGVALGRIAAEPFAGLAWVHLRTGGFVESGGVAALSGSASGDDVGYSTLGARLATSYILPNGMALLPRVSASWQHAFNGIAPTVALAFQNTGAGFAITGVPLAREAALVETGLDLRVSPQAKLGLSYSGQLAGHLQDHAVKGNFTWNF